VTPLLTRGGGRGAFHFRERGTKNREYLVRGKGENLEQLSFHYEATSRKGTRSKCLPLNDYPSSSREKKSSSPGCAKGGKYRGLRPRHVSCPERH